MQDDATKIPKAAIFGGKRGSWERCVCSVGIGNECSFPKLDKAETSAVHMEHADVTNTEVLLSHALLPIMMIMMGYAPGSAMSMVQQHASEASGIEMCRRLVKTHEPECKNKKITGLAGTFD